MQSFNNFPVVNTEEDDFSEERINIEFLNKLIAILSSYASIDAAVRDAECCKIANKPVFLSSFEDYFQELAAEQALSYTIDTRIEYTLKSYGLPVEKLNRRFQIIFGSALAAAQHQLTEQYQPLIIKWSNILMQFPGLLSSKDKQKIAILERNFQIINTHLANTTNRVVKQFDECSIYKLSRYLEYRDESCLIAYQTIYYHYLFRECKEEILAFIKKIDNHYTATQLLQSIIDKRKVHGIQLEKSPLGKIFWEPRNPLSIIAFSLFHPAETKGTLALAKIDLNNRLHCFENRENEKNLIELLDSYSLYKGLRDFPSTKAEHLNNFRLT